MLLMSAATDCTACCSIEARYWLPALLLGTLPALLCDSEAQRPCWLATPRPRLPPPSPVPRLAARLGERVMTGDAGPAAFGEPAPGRLPLLSRLGEQGCGAGLGGPGQGLDKGLPTAVPCPGPLADAGDSGAQEGEVLADASWAARGCCTQGAAKDA